MAFTLRLLTQKSEMLPHYPLLKQLSPGVTEARYAALLDEMLPHGYRMAAVFSGSTCIGISGIWVAAKFYSGRYLELDNVVIDKDFRSHGIGKLLLDFITDLAQREGVETLMLDAYLENEPAHRFYERDGFFKRGYHFLKKLGE